MSPFSPPLGFYGVQYPGRTDDVGSRPHTPWYTDPAPV
jgi:hypothetical protein